MQSETPNLEADSLPEAADPETLEEFCGDPELPGVFPVNEDFVVGEAAPVEFGGEPPEPVILEYSIDPSAPLVYHTPPPVIEETTMSYTPYEYDAARITSLGSTLMPYAIEPQRVTSLGPDGSMGFYSHHHQMNNPCLGANRVLLTVTSFKFACGPAPSNVHGTEDEKVIDVSPDQVPRVLQCLKMQHDVRHGLTPDKADAGASIKLGSQVATSLPVGSVMITSPQRSPVASPNIKQLDHGMTQYLPPSLLPPQNRMVETARYVSGGEVKFSTSCPLYPRTYSQPGISYYNTPTGNLHVKSNPLAPMAASPQMPIDG